MSVPSARHCQVEDTVLSTEPQVPECPCRVDPTWAVPPVTVGFAVTAMVPGETVTAADCTVLGVMPGADSVTVATSCLPTRAAAGTNEVLSSVFATGDPAAVHRIVVVVGVGLHVPGSRVTVPPTLTVPPITGVPTVVKGRVDGAKSTVTAAPAPAPVGVRVFT